VFAVGDDDQTIYGYNGADPAWLIDFADYFPGAVHHALTVNYRCPQDVVEAADRLLRRNRRRVSKTITAASSRTGLMLHDASPDPVGVTRSVVDAALAQGQLPAAVAVLTRVNSMLAPVQVALVSSGVPVAGGVGREFLQRTAVRSALAWLRLAEDSNLAASDIEEALRRPSRSLHPRITEWVTEQRSVDALRKLAARVTTEKDADRIAAFADDIERVRRAHGSEARLRVVRDGIGLGASVAGLDQKRHGMNRAAQSDDLTALVQIAALVPTDQPFERWLDRMLATPWDPSGVTLSTVHRVKGLEWPTVVIHGATPDQFPHALADDVEEERRVFHVALTRGSHSVHVVPGEQPSPFIRELTTEPSAGEPSLRPVSTSASASASTSSLLAASRPGHDLTGADAALFEQLKLLRRHLADGKPAYVVFGDAVLDAIARVRPRSLAELGQLKGVGPAKLDQYGQQFVEAVTSFEAAG
jgi:DNA helicase II / ATP-dependent DNA helicase PcrA